MTHIFKPSHIFTGQTGGQTEECEMFTLDGLQDFKDVSEAPRVNTEDDRVYAKRTKRIDGTIKYSIRTGLDKKLYNPISPIDKESNRAFLDKVSRSNDKFRSVNQKAFDWYLKFLITKNTAWLYNAEREAE